QISGFANATVRQSRRVPDLQEINNRVSRGGRPLQGDGSVAISRDRWPSGPGGRRGACERIKVYRRRGSRCERDPGQELRSTPIPHALWFDIDTDWKCIPHGGAWVEGTLRMNRNTGQR